MTQATRPDLEAFGTEVLSRLGFRLDEHNAEAMDLVLRRRLDRTGCKTVEAYLGRYQDSGFAAGELREVALEVTVPETYFFRHPEQFQALAEVALPERFKARKANQPLNILSAGCASGEEAYSIAAILLRVPGVRDSDLNILGIDVNRHLLQVARRARYSEWALRAVGEPERSRLFRREGSDYVLDERIRSLVRFEERNLLDADESFWRKGAFDIIFCRNLIIYFTPKAIRELTARLTRSLVVGGFLFLGTSETLRGISQDFHLRHTHGAFYYQRKLTGEPPAPAIASPAAEAPAIELPLIHTERGPRWAVDISEAGKRAAALENQSHGAPPGTDREAAANPAAGPAFPAKRDLDEVRALLRQERFEDALRAIGTLPKEVASDPDTLMVQAVLLANSGELGRAEQLCERLLAKDELRPGAHYLMAVCQEKRGNPLSAVDHDQTAIYLNPKFAMPRLHLGLLARRLGDLRTARQELSEALALLEREDSSRILLFGGGFSREALIQFCQAQLQLCGGRP